jgi:hypothetical protein
MTPLGRSGGDTQRVLATHTRPAQQAGFGEVHLPENPFFRAPSDGTQRVPGRRWEREKVSLEGL